MNTIKGTQGSITLEACMVVPIFIIIMLLANGFFSYVYRTAGYGSCPSPKQ